MPLDKVFWPLGIYEFMLTLNFVQHVKMKKAQSCSTVYDPMDCGPPGSSAHGILQARILEWVAIPFSRGSSWPRDQTQVSCISGRLFTIWAIVAPGKIPVSFGNP